MQQLVAHRAKPTPKDADRSLGRSGLSRRHQADFNSQHTPRASGATENREITDVARPGFDFSQIPAHSPTLIGIQPKLTIGATGDVFEQEADRVADQVMRMPEPLPDDGVDHSRHAAAPAAGVQTKSTQAGNSSGTAAPPIVHEVLDSPGQPLDRATRAFMEPRFGYDFSGVRVHSDDTAAEAARELHANAFTSGRDIAFREGKFAPQASLGQRLLAHELTHVLQQRQSGVASIQRDKATEEAVKKVTSPTLEAAEENVGNVEDQLYDRVEKREGDIDELLDQLAKGPKTKATTAKIDALTKDREKSVADIIAGPDSKYLSPALRKDIMESAKHFDAAGKKRDTTQKKWTKYDAKFASDEVVKALGTDSLTSAELKALIAKESGDLMNNDVKGDIAGIAQMGSAEEKLVGGKKDDRKDPEKAIVLAAKVIKRYSDDLDAALTNKPSGKDRKKFIMAAYNGGVNLVVQAQNAAIAAGSDGKTWESLANGGEKSPLYAAIKKTYPAGKEKGKYAEVTSYVTKIYERLANVK